MKRKLLLIPMLLSLAVPLLPQNSTTFNGTMILGQPTGSSVTVNTRTNSSLQLYYEFGIVSAAYTGQSQTVVSNADPYAAGFYVSQSLISGLAADTQYFYRMRYRAAGSSAPYLAGSEYSFHTQRAPGSSFVFAVQGDSHPERDKSMFNSNLYIQTLTAVAAEKPDFYITSGDDFSVDTLPAPYTSAAVTGRYTLQLPYFDVLGRSAALFLGTGNHEETSLSNYSRPADANNSNMVPIWAQNARNLYYSVPGPSDPNTGNFYTGNMTMLPGIGLLRDYYAWQWGDALFVVIDPYWSSPAQVDTGLGDDKGAGGTKTADKWSITHGDAQYQWLKQTLEQSKAKWKFIFAHHVMGTGRGGIEIANQYEWGGNNANGAWGFPTNRPSWPVPLHQLMVANHVTIFFQAHDHLFVHQQLDGVTYQELPNPADNTYTAFNSDAYTSGDQFPNAGYTKVTVRPASVKVDYIREWLPQDQKPPTQVSGMIQFSYTITSPGTASLAMNAGAGGSASSATSATNQTVQTGYATATVGSGTTPYSTAVFSLSQNGTVVSEAAVPASPPTTDARIYIDNGNQVQSGPPRFATALVNVSTGFAVANPETSAATVTYTLRDVQGNSLAIGHGSIAAGAHIARFLSQLQDLAPDFVLPAAFSTATRYGSLEIASTQPLSILALRMTINQRGNTLITSVPVADLTQTSSSASLYFPQVADGGGYTTSIILLNTTSAAETGSILFYRDDGSAMTVTPIAGTSGTRFRYSIPAGGIYLLQTDGSPVTANVGSAQLIPDTGSTSPVGAGIFGLTGGGGYLVTESGIRSSTPTTHARVYVDLSGGHDSGLAIAAPDSNPLHLTIQAFQTDGVTAAGTSPTTLNLNGNGHGAAFAGQWIAGLPSDFRGVLDISAASPFAALTLRALTNGAGDFLLTTFPVADFTQPAPSPIIFPQVADGGGYQTQFILLSPGGAGSATVLLFGDDGKPLLVAP